MKKIATATALALIANLVLVVAQPISPVDCVSTLVGTQSKHEFSTGNTYPAVARPWGMNFWTPQTGTMGNGWTYTYTADKIVGFKQTHQPSPWINDYGQFAIMPTAGSAVFDEQSRASWFSHKAERATPYYYSVYLADHNVKVELTPTERAAAFRITYPDNEPAFLVIDALDKGSSVSVDREHNRITGYTTKNSGGVPDNFRCWFVIESDTEFEPCWVVSDGTTPDSSTTSANGNHCGAVVGFGTRHNRPIELRVASSLISPEQAELNLCEVKGREFDAIANEGRDSWNEVLGRIEVVDSNIDNLRTFYSCLYRATLFPRDLSEIDADGRRIHYSPYNGRIEEGYMYTDTGFWDTFRSLFPLLNLVYPDRNEQIQQGLANTFRQSGFLPEWASPGHRNCMVGNNSASVVADAWIKGVRTFPTEELWEAVVHGSNAVHPSVGSTGRLGYDFYNTLGYVPCDVGIRESAARTLEYSYDDWCIYTLGRALGKPQSEIELFAQRATNYRNLFDSQSSLMRGRNADGSFQTPFNPLKWGDAFTEGNSLHYTWSVFHDPAGLIELMGGSERFAAKIDSVFLIAPDFDASYYGGIIHEIREMQVIDMGNYAHGNQPIQHLVYLYDWAGQPWKCQYRCREVMRRLYNASPDGYCGDEDNGQTSAWYIFSAMGFYTVCPASDQYAIGSPLFDKVVIHRPDGVNITIEADNNSVDNVYIDSMTVDGRKQTRNYLTHSELIGGAKIRFKMSPEPNRQRGTNRSDLPYSFSTDSGK